MVAVQTSSKALSIRLHPEVWQWMVLGGGPQALAQVKQLLKCSPGASITIISDDIIPAFFKLQQQFPQVLLVQQQPAIADASNTTAVIIATGNAVIDDKLAQDAKQEKLLVFLPANHAASDFIISSDQRSAGEKKEGRYWLNDQSWKQVTTKLIIGFLVIIVAHIFISYLPLPSVHETWLMIKPHFTTQFFLFILAGFLAQLVDGVLSMGYGVTSATCLMTAGVNPVAMSASIHTSEIFTSGISGYSHYKFGNVNKKLFKHLVIPGVLGAIGGAALLVYLGEEYSDYLMPIVALYAGFLGLRILFKAFKEPVKGKKVKRIGLLAGAGGFLDSFGGGGWGPIVTSSLMAKGRSPKYTIGSVSLTEFFVTLASAFTFFITVGVGHWNIVLGLMIGGSIAAPLGARLAGKLPRKTMMIAVGIMVIIWCVRMIIKSI